MCHLAWTLVYLIKVLNAPSFYERKDWFSGVVCELLHLAKQPIKKTNVSLLPAPPYDMKWLRQAVISHHIVVMMLWTESNSVIFPQPLP